MAPDDDLDEALYISLRCICTKCQAYLEMPEIEHLWENETSEWSRRSATIAKRAGWTVSAACNVDLLCPNCSAAEN